MECLFTVENLVAAAMACRDKPEIGSEFPFITETGEVAYLCGGCGGADGHRHVFHSGSRHKELLVCKSHYPFPRFHRRHVSLPAVCMVERQTYHSAAREYLGNGIHCAVLAVLSVCIRRT